MNAHAFQRTLFLFIFISSSALAKVTLPKIFTDNMVLQRDRSVKIWGWATTGETITVSFNGQKVKSKTDATGGWNLTLKPMQHGGPFVMTIAGKSESLTLKNILIGDVWICSGQSNMEWIVKNTNNPEKEIAASNYPKIRLFAVQKALSYVPLTDIDGGKWLECNPQTVGDFSAVAYFFGRKLLKELDVPIGLINSSWGGTNIQTWISWDVMSKKAEYKNIDLKELEKTAITARENQKKFQDAIKNDKGITEKWYESTTTTDWKIVSLPQLWERTAIGNADGIIWFKKEFELPASLENKRAEISLGPIDDWDNTYINGKLVGSENLWNKDRLYALDPGLLKAGKNTIVIKVTDTGGGGGIYGKGEQLYVDVGGQRISLAGEWYWKSSVLTTDFGIQDVGPNSFPSQLYNSMIAPITGYAIKGGIWYQGESNAYQAHTYRTLFAELITNWRTKWGYEFPFFWVQLANYMEPVTFPEESDWAELRESQSMTLALPQTGQAVIIDIGEADDIHPRNKQDVGLRLALAALKVTYGKDIVYSGPVYRSMNVEGNKIILRFSNTGSGLSVKDKYGYLKGFAIAGSDKKFVWAKAYIEGDNVVVYSDAINNPVAVRYAWAHNPDDANLYNKENLPASPFRTDTWPGTTEGK